MKRRDFMKSLAALPFVPCVLNGGEDEQVSGRYRYTNIKAPTGTVGGKDTFDEKKLIEILESDEFINLDKAPAVNIIRSNNQYRA